MSNSLKTEAETLQKIEKILTNKNKKSSNNDQEIPLLRKGRGRALQKSQKRSPSPTRKSPNKNAHQSPQTSRSKSPVPSPPKSSQQTPKRHNCLNTERKQTPNKGDQTLQKTQNTNFKVQNKHSHFLNAKNPKPPIYQRAKQLARDRSKWLQQKTQQKQRQRQALQQQQIDIINQTISKTIPKKEAIQLSQKLYKDHYKKLLKHNEQYLHRAKIDSLNYKIKPDINGTSKEIFKLFTEKNQYENNVFERFEQYNASRKRNKEMNEMIYKKKYYPFQPTISQNSHQMATARTDREMVRTKHCLSCHQMKRDASGTHLAKSINKDHSPKRSKNDGQINLRPFY